MNWSREANVLECHRGWGNQPPLGNFRKYGKSREKTMNGDSWRFHLCIQRTCKSDTSKKTADWRKITGLYASPFHPFSYTSLENDTATFSSGTQKVEFIQNISRTVRIWGTYVRYSTKESKRSGQRSVTRWPLQHLPQARRYVLFLYLRGRC